MCLADLKCHRSCHTSCRSVRPLPPLQAYYVLVPTAVKTRHQRRLQRLTSHHHGPHQASSWLSRLRVGFSGRGGRGVAPWQGLDIPGSPTAAGGLQRASLDGDSVPGRAEEAQPEAQPAEHALPTRDDSAHGGPGGDPTLQQLAEHVQQATGTEEADEGEGDAGAAPGTQPQRRVTRAVAIEHQRRQLEKLAEMRRQEQEGQREQQQQGQMQQGQDESQPEQEQAPRQQERQRLAVRPSSAALPKQERWPQRMQRWLMHGFVTPVFG